MLVKDEVFDVVARYDQRHGVCVGHAARVHEFAVWLGAVVNSEGGLVATEVVVAQVKLFVPSSTYSNHILRRPDRPCWIELTSPKIRFSETEVDFIAKHACAIISGI